MSSWNQFRFTGGGIEVATTLSGLNDVAGLWPVVWAPGHLGRSGYGGNLEGVVHIPLGETRAILVYNFCNGLIPMIHVMAAPPPDEPRTMY